MIRWIVLDMDGTLLNQAGKISERTKQALIRCQEKGMKVILASGRSYSRLMRYARELQMDRYGGYFIEVNGVAVYDLAAGRREVFRRFEPQEVEEVFHFCMQQQAEVQCVQDRAVYYWIPEWHKPLKAAERVSRGLPPSYPNLGGAWTWNTDSRDGYPVQREVAQARQVPGEINKINCINEPKENSRIYGLMEEAFAGRYEYARTCPRLIEISPKGVTKGDRLQQMMIAHGVRPQEVIAFGDGENDVKMFQAVDHSFAMANAEDFVKAKAFAVTRSNEEDGVACVLEELL